jgi:hypothetical protein
VIDNEEDHKKRGRAVAPADPVDTEGTSPMSASTIQQEQWIKEAKALGETHGRDAASYVYDGNSDVKERQKVLAMLREGDPAVWDYLPQQPNLSGEWADSLTPRSLFIEVTGLDAHAEATYNVDAYGNVCDALCEAYEEGVSETFESTCETELIKFCTTNATVAADALACFEKNSGHDKIKDGSPDWIKDAIHAAHDGKLPDDWSYQVSREAFSAIAEETEADEFSNDVDCYTSDLVTWLGSHSDRMGYCTQAQEEGMVDVDADVERRISAGQYIERRFIFDAILSAVEAQVEEVTA